jgi:pimeloyl-ACP methyl ester carboxylesterase
MSVIKEKFKDITLCSNGNRPIIADLFIQDHEAPLILFCHGFKGFKDWGGFNLVADRFSKEGYHFVKFNFSHNGGTSEQVIDFPDLDAFSDNTYSKEQEDIRLVIQALKAHPLLKDVWPSRELTLMGHSRGGAMVTLAAARHKEVVGLVTMAAVADLESRFQAYDLPRWKKEGVVYVANGRTGQNMPLKYEYYVDFMKNRETLNVLKAASNLSIPSLIIHAKDDEVVAFTEAQDLHEAIPDSECYLLETGGHTFGMSQPWTKTELPPPTALLMQKVISFLKRKVGIGHSC